MKHYFIDVKINCCVVVEEHKKGSFHTSPDIKFSHGSAKKEYLNKLRTMSDELNRCIEYIEAFDGDYIPPVLLLSIHGIDNQTIDDEYNKETFGDSK